MLRNQLPRGLSENGVILIFLCLKQPSVEYLAVVCEVQQREAPLFFQVHPGSEGSLLYVVEDLRVVEVFDQADELVLELQENDEVVIRTVLEKTDELQVQQRVHVVAQIQLLDVSLAEVLREQLGHAGEVGLVAFGVSEEVHQGVTPYLGVPVADDCRPLGLGEHLPLVEELPQVQ